MIITREGSASSTFSRLAWSNLAAQSAEQVGLAAAPLVAVLALGAGAGETGLLQTAQTLPFLLLSIPAGVLAGTSFFLVGVGPILWVISTATLRQTVTPRDLLGRVSAIGMTASGARPVGAAIGAAVASVYGLEVCLVVAAVGFLVQASIILTSPVLRLARQPEMVG